MRTLIRSTVVLFGLATSQAFAIPIVVDALGNSSSGGVGASTGLVLAAGESFSVSVDPTDLWSAGPLPRWSTADGLIADLFATGSDESGQPAGTLIGTLFGNHSQFGLSAPFGALVGSIAGNYFLIGTSFSGPAPAAGELLLHYWDSNNFDNEDFITAEVSRDGTTPLPEPATLLLFALGLIGIGARQALR